MLVGVVRARDGVRRKVLADRETERVVTGLPRVPLEARPAEVLDGRVRRAVDRVDLLVVVPADVADPDLVRSGAEREPERIPEPVRDDAPRVRVAVPEERVRRECGTRGRAHADERAVE